MLGRRRFLNTSILGAAALHSLLAGAAPSSRRRASSVIFLFMSGGPSHPDLFDFKPRLLELEGRPIPPSVQGGQRRAQTSGMPMILAGPQFPFERRGRQRDVLISSLLPHLGQCVDELAIVRSLYSDSVNHDPAATLLLTGSESAGRPTLGSWVSYGLGQVERNLPAYVVLMSGDGGQPLPARFWHSGFLPGSHQGVRLRAQREPVPYLTDPPGIDRAGRDSQLQALRALNRERLALTSDPEIATRIASYEMAFRMQMSLPDAADLGREPRAVLDRYGACPGAASFANNCLLARRLVERGVPFVQLIDRDWDHHLRLLEDLPTKCRHIDQPCAALVQDLKQRGLLDSTLVVWAGEFGRTAFSQGTLGDRAFGRDHHPGCFTVWLAGGGIKPGIVVGRTDDFAYNIEEAPIHIHDLNATILHCLGFDHTELTYRSQGRDFRLTDVAGRVVPELLA
jgi:hypothetical protein